MRSWMSCTSRKAAKALRRPTSGVKAMRTRPSVWRPGDSTSSRRSRQMNTQQRWKPMQQRLPYEARSEEEMQRNLARLGTKWQRRERDWDERLGDYGPPLPLLPLVCTLAIITGVVGVVVVLSVLVP